MVIEIGGRRIGTGERCFVIAEAGVNHDGDPEKALALVDAAVACGADAVKFQTFEPKLLASDAAPKAEYQERDGAGGSQLDMLRRLALDADAHRRIQRRALEKGIVFFSSPFEETSADLLASLGVPAMKIPSGEVTNLPFLRHVASKRLPMLVSTGMCVLDEVRDAVETIRASGNPPIALFHCVSSYPAAAADCNLRAIATLRDAFEVPVGWSDHTLGHDVAVAAVALGANLLEKHLTLDRNAPGPDHRASLDPSAFTALVEAVRSTEQALGDGEKVPVAAERAIAAVARKSLHWRRDLREGARVADDDFVALRPGTGVPPARAAFLAGRRLRVGVTAFTAVHEEDFESA